MSELTVLITGANKGIGLAILQTFAQKSPSSTFILCCRNPTDGAAAVEKLRTLGIQSKIDVLKLDVTSDESLAAAVDHVRSVHGKLDILINNAGISPAPTASLSDVRAIFTATYATNVSSVAAATTLFLPLLKATSADARVINVGSTTSSFAQAGRFAAVPPAHVAYVSSKAALNMLTMYFAKMPGNEGVLFQVAGPGLCRTDLNEGSKGRPGARDPLDGARVFVELALAERGMYASGFWFMGDEDEEAVSVPW